jgi:hypothetical protein
MRDRQANTLAVSAVLVSSMDEQSKMLETTSELSRFQLGFSMPLEGLSTALKRG